MESIHTRRTIRQYCGRNIEPELLEKLLSEAARTQTMGNLQLYSVVVTRSDADVPISVAQARGQSAARLRLVTTMCSVL